MPVQEPVKLAEGKGRGSGWGLSSPETGWVGEEEGAQLAGREPQTLRAQMPSNGWIGWGSPGRPAEEASPAPGRCWQGCARGGPGAVPALVWTAWGGGVGGGG